MKASRFNMILAAALALTAVSFAPSASMACDDISCGGDIGGGGDPSGGSGAGATTVQEVIVTAPMPQYNWDNIPNYAFLYEYINITAVGTTAELQYFSQYLPQAEQITSQYGHVISTQRVTEADGTVTATRVWVDNNGVVTYTRTTYSSTGFVIWSVVDGLGQIIAGPFGGDMT